MRKFTTKLLSLVLAVMLALTLTVFSVGAAEDDGQSAADDAAVSVVGDDDAQTSEDGDAQTGEDYDAQTGEDDAAQAGENDAAQTAEEEATQAAEEDNAAGSDDDNSVNTDTYTCELYTAGVGSSTYVMSDSGSELHRYAIANISDATVGPCTITVYKNGESIKQTQASISSSVMIQYYYDYDCIEVNNSDNSAVASYFAMLKNDSTSSETGSGMAISPYDDNCYSCTLSDVAAGTYTLSVFLWGGTETITSVSVSVKNDNSTVEVIYNSDTESIEYVVNNSVSTDNASYTCTLVNDSTGVTSDVGMTGSTYQSDCYYATFTDVASGSHTIYVGNNSGYLCEATYTFSASKNTDLTVYYNNSTGVITVCDENGGTQVLETSETNGSKSSKITGTASSGAKSATSDTAKNDGNAVKTGITIAVIAGVVLILGGAGFFIFKRKIR